MFSKLIFSLALAAAVASPFINAEVPQEHSHDKLLDPVRALLSKGGLIKNGGVKADPGFFADPVFAVLGNAKANSVASDGDGVCLQQNMADAAFSLATTAQDKGAVIMFRALERNTNSVGLKSDLCTKTPKNPELNGIQQHQDPASDGAADHNKQVELAVAQALLNLGLDPTLALQTATFPPGQKGDPTAKGRTCDTANCIFTQNLLTPIATAADISVLKKGGNSVVSSAGITSSSSNNNNCACAAGGQVSTIISQMESEIKQLKARLKLKRKRRV